MAVLIPNVSLGVVHRPDPTLDAHGWRLPAALGAPAGPWPGRVEEHADHLFVLALDPAAWPVIEADVVVESGGDSRTWLVTAADLLRNNADPTVDYVRVEGRLRVDGHTEPPGAPGVR